MPVIERERNGESRMRRIVELNERTIIELVAAEKKRAIQKKSGEKRSRQRRKKREEYRQETTRRRKKKKCKCQWKKTKGTRAIEQRPSRQYIVQVSVGDGALNKPRPVNETRGYDACRRMAM